MQRPHTATIDLDNDQYTLKSILAYEKIYGRYFVSPGGSAVAEELISTMALPEHARVLDAGCGIGGSAFLMASKFRLDVVGIDLSENMLNLAQKNATELGLADQIQLHLADCLTLKEHDHYDAIYSRDVFLHIADKQKLFSVLYQSLKTGGQLLFTDYCCGEQPWDPEFTQYVDTRGYTLHTLPSYAALVNDAGFSNVIWQDRTQQFVTILENELKTIEGLSTNETEISRSKTAWQKKLSRARGGDQRWGLITATK